MSTHEPVDEDGDTARSHVRVRVEMVLEIAERDEVTRAAWARIEADEQLPAGEREQAARAVSRDAAEAVAYLVDPVDLVGDMPGVQLTQASWSSELTAYDPDEEWYIEEDADIDDETEDETDDDYGDGSGGGRA